jgi:hypothetical protein
MRRGASGCRRCSLGQLNVSIDHRVADATHDVHASTNKCSGRPQGQRSATIAKRLLTSLVVLICLMNVAVPTSSKTSCCNTPVGNTLSPTIPFVGILAQAFDNCRQHPNDVFGKPIGAIMGRYAIGPAPAGSKGIKLSLLMRAGYMVLGWRMRGQTWPHPFFTRDTRAPIYPLTVLSSPQRESLRRFCGPAGEVIKQ